MSSSQVIKWSKGRELSQVESRRRIKSCVPGESVPEEIEVAILPLS